MYCTEKILCLNIHTYTQIHLGPDLHIEQTYRKHTGTKSNEMRHRNDWLEGIKTAATLQYSAVPNALSFKKKHCIHFLAFPPNVQSDAQVGDENATFPAGSPRHVIRRGIWCPIQALGTMKCSKSENSSVFLQISPCPWLKCYRERGGG